MTDRAIPAKPFRVDSLALGTTLVVLLGVTVGGSFG